METNQATAAIPQPAFADRMRHSKSLIAIVAVLGVTVMALSAALVVNRSEAQPDARVSETRLSDARVADGRASDPRVLTAVPALAAPVAQAAPVNASIQAPTAATKPVPAKVVAAAPKPVYTHPTPRPAPTVIAKNEVCNNCGTVVAVNPVKRQGQVNGVPVGNTTIGLGTVAGGVLGGLLGSQVGGGDGKKAMAVLGAVGGAYAGNKVEQNMKSVTVYDVRIRMNDGSFRNMEVSSPVGVGSQVTVEGNNIRMATAAG